MIPGETEQETERHTLSLLAIVVVAFFEVCLGREDFEPNRQRQNKRVSERARHGRTNGLGEGENGNDEREDARRDTLAEAWQESERARKREK